MRYRTRKGAELRWPRAVDFLCDLSQHIPPPRRQTVSCHGHFANPLGRLEKRREPTIGEPPSTERTRRTRWARLVLRVWKSDPKLCPSCGKRMARSRAIMERAELSPDSGVGRVNSSALLLGQARNGIIQSWARAAGCSSGWVRRLTT